MVKAMTLLSLLKAMISTLLKKDRMVIIRNHLDYVEEAICKLDSRLDELIEPYEPYISLLCSIPGIERRSATVIISEIGINMDQFSNSKRLCHWAGLSPGSNESAGKKKSVRISRASVYLKPALVQVAHASVKSNESPYYKNKYERISKWIHISSACISPYVISRHKESVLRMPK